MIVVNCCPSRWKAVGKLSLIFFQPQSRTVVLKDKPPIRCAEASRLFGPVEGEAACGSVVAQVLLVGTGGTVPPASLEPCPL